MNRKTVIVAVLLAFTLAGPSLGASSKRPLFSARVDNPWFPLRPGTTYVYRGFTDGAPARDVVTVTHRTKMIDGVPCAVVDDRVYSGGFLRERTSDWYTQDGAGNVWYYGEATAELDKHGRVTTTEGSWRTGRNGARPGIFMPAHPRVGQSFRQEFLKGHAEDHFRVLSLRATVKVPYTSTKHALLTKEWTPLEKGVVGQKGYVRGLGMVLERNVKGPKEHMALVSVTRKG